MYDGKVKLYREVDKFHQLTGILLSFCVPPNKSAEDQGRDALYAAMQALYDKYKGIVVGYEKRPMGREECIRLAYSVSALKRIKRQRLGEVTCRLRKNMKRYCGVE